MKLIVILITFKNASEAKKIADVLLNKKLIACANFCKAKSFFIWKNKIKNANEVIGIFKTKKENWQIVVSQIKKLHSYDLPEIIKFNIEADQDYRNWIKQSIG